MDRGVVKETGRVTPTGPRARRAASITVVVPVDPMNILLGLPADTALDGVRPVIPLCDPSALQVQ
jgi:hypothetical protein